jgi:type VI secretion system protein ImpB
MKELPFMVGVLGDFTGMPTQPLPRIRDRKLIEVNPDNFDAVLEGMQPHLSYSVTNKLSDNPDAAPLRIDLNFSTIEDFDPVNVCNQVRPLRELLDLRVKLTDLLGTLQGNDRLDEILTDVVTDPEKLRRLRAEIAPPRPVAAMVETAIEPTASSAVMEPESAAMDDKAATELAAGESEVAVIEAEAVTDVEPAADMEAATETATEAEPITAADATTVEEEPSSPAAGESITQTDSSPADIETAMETRPGASDVEAAGETAGDTEAAGEIDSTSETDRDKQP